MPTFIVFIITLFLIFFLFLFKGWEVSSGRNFFWKRFFKSGDIYLEHLFKKVDYWWGYVNARNCQLLFCWIAVSIKRLFIIIKRRFDHEQSHFFTRRDTSIPKSKKSASFFLKDVSEYKKELRKGNKNK